MLLRAAFAWRCQLIQCCCLCPGTLAPSLLRHPATAHKDAKLLAWLCCYSAFVSPQTVCVGMCVCVCVCAELHIFSILRLNVIVVAGLLLQLLLRLCRNNFIWSCHFLLPLGCYCCCFIFIHNSTFLWAWTWVQFVLPHPPHHPLRYRPSCESRWY